MRDWIKDNFNVIKDGYLNEETWEYEDTFEFECNGKELGAVIPIFISIFGERKPTSVEDMKSKVREGQWHDIIDCWKEQGILK